MAARKPKETNVTALIEAQPQPEAAALVSVIERAATNPAVDIDKMERLLQMHERIVSRDAERAFNEAMAQAQAEMTVVSVDADNPQTRSKYASYGQLDRHLRPIYSKHGFCLSFGTDVSAVEGCVRVTCLVSRGGFSRQYHIDMPNDGKGAKGGDVMTRTHATGAAASYGMRYLLKMIFNVAVGEADTDGNLPTQTITTQQAADLAALIDEVGADRGRFLKYLGVATLEALPAAKYDAAVKALAAKRKQS